MWLSLVGTEARLNATQWTLTSEREQRFVDSFLRVAPQLDLGGYVFQLGERQRLTRAWAQFQQQYPIVLGPVSTRVPFRVDEDLAGDGAVADIIAAHRLVLAMNLLALPVATMPVGIADGLPQAVQLIGPRLREDLCLDAAQTLQDQVGAIAPIAPRMARRDDSAQRKEKHHVRAGTGQ
jgi:amidase